MAYNKLVNASQLTTEVKVDRIEKFADILRDYQHNVSALIIEDFAYILGNPEDMTQEQLNNVLYDLCVRICEHVVNNSPDKYSLETAINNLRYTRVEK